MQDEELNTRETPEVVEQDVSYDELEEQASGRKPTMIYAAVALVILVAIGAAYYFFNYLPRQEEQAWDKVKNSHEKEVVQRYISDYPNSVHYQEACDRLDYVQNEEKQWQAAKASGDTTALLAFIDEYEDGPLVENATDLLHRLRREEYGRLHSQEYLESLMKEIAACRNRGETKDVINTFGSQALIDTYKDYERRVMLMDGSTASWFFSIAGEAVSDITDLTCTMTFTLTEGYEDGGEEGYFSHPVVMKLKLEGTRWVIDDIIENRSFRKDPSSFVIG